jgi:hypothetical protein
MCRTPNGGRRTRNVGPLRYAPHDQEFLAVIRLRGDNMVEALLLALIAALILAVIGVIFKKPREAAASWIRALNRRVRLRLYLQHREDTKRAIERIAAELAQRRYNEEGNPDDEYYADWYRWFTGDPDANIDYERKQQRDIERLKRGDFNPQPPRS